MCKYGAFSVPYFHALGLNMERYSVSFRVQPECGKYGPEKTPYLDTFHEMTVDFVTFTEEIFNGKLHFLCGEM